MPKNGTATNTEIASADVVESEPVGASYPGMIVHRLDTAMNRNKVPRKPRYLTGLWRPTSLICSSIVVTTISRKPCQRGMCASVTSLRVINHAPTVITSINTQVVTIVLLSSTKRYCQKTSSSGVRRRTAGLLFQWSLLFHRRVCELPHDDDARDHKSNKARHEPRPMTLRNKIESSQDHTGSQQKAAEEPERRPLGHNTLMHRPPKAAEEERTKQGAAIESEDESQDVTHPDPPSSPCIPFQPNARH